MLVSSSDGIELEGLCDRVLIFARGRIVARIDRRGGHRRRHHRSQSDRHRFAREQGASAGAQRPALARIRRQRSFSRSGAGSPHRYHSRRHAGAERLFPVAVQHQEHAVVLQHLDISVLRAAWPRCWSAPSICRSVRSPVFASCWPRSSCRTASPRDRSAAGLILILLFTIGFGLLQGLLITSLRLPAIVVTIATFIGLQGVSLLLRPIAAGSIDDAISDAAQFPLVVSAGRRCC